MYEIQFVASSSADWAQAIELINAETNQPLDLPAETTFTFRVGQHCWGGITASTPSDNIIFPLPHILQWQFSPANMDRFPPGDTYRVGLTMTTDEGTVQLLVGTLTMIDGVV